MRHEESGHRRRLIDLYKEKFGEHIPLIRRQDVRGFVQRKITDELAPFDLDLDFTGKRTPRDLLVTFSGENPGWPAYGESARIRVNGIAGSGDSTIWVGAMKTMRLATSPQACEAGC